MLIIKNAINKLKRISAITVVFLLSIFIISYAASEQFDIKGKIVNLEIEPSNDPQNPNLWPCLIADNKQNILAAGSPDILKELYDLSGKEVTLNVKKLPMQNFSGKEYGCYEVAEIEKLRGQEYLSPRKAIKEFKQALQERNIISESGTQTIEGAIRSIWYDKNENKKRLE